MGGRNHEVIGRMVDRLPGSPRNSVIASVFTVKLKGGGDCSGVMTLGKKLEESSAGLKYLLCNI
jgi:hypothetical protein